VKSGNTAFRSIMLRLSILAVGAIVVAYGLQLMNRGIFAYQNKWFRGTNYSAGTVAAGAFIGLLAFLPPAAWVDRWLRKKPKQTAHPTYHQRHHSPR
jgi:hypothetical protein